MYRTGDVVYRHADGRLVFAGRNDDQLKIRGFRVEPGEVEQALRSAPGVSAAVVRSIGDTGGNDGGLRLIGYIVPAAAGQGTEAGPNPDPAPTATSTTASCPTLSGTTSAGCCRTTWCRPPSS